MTTKKVNKLTESQVEALRETLDYVKSISKKDRQEIERELEQDATKDNECGRPPFKRIPMIFNYTWPTINIPFIPIKEQLRFYEGSWDLAQQKQEMEDDIQDVSFDE